MRFRPHAAAVFAVVALASVTVRGQTTYSHCETLLREGLRESSIARKEDSRVAETFERYCESSGEARSTSIGIGAEAIIKSIPARLTGTYGSTQEGFRNFCRNYQTTQMQFHSEYLATSRPLARAYDSFDTCVKLAATGVIIEGHIPTKATLDVRVQPSTITLLEIQGVFPSPNLSCTGAIDGVPAAIDKSLIRRVTSPITFQCSRTPRLVNDPIAGVDVEVWEEASVQVLNNQGNFSLVMPEVQVLPQRLASELAAKVAKLEDRMGRPLVRCAYPSDASVPFAALQFDNVVLNFPACSLDTHGAVNRVDNRWQFTAPLSGWYRVTVSALATHGFVSINLLKNGNEVVPVANHLSRKPGYAESIFGSNLIRLDRGQSFVVRATGRFDDVGRFESGSGSNWIEVQHVRD